MRCYLSILVYILIYCIINTVCLYCTCLCAVLHWTLLQVQRVHWNSLVTPRKKQCGLTHFISAQVCQVSRKIKLFSYLTHRVLLTVAECYDLYSKLKCTGCSTLEHAVCTTCNIMCISQLDCVITRNFTKSSKILVNYIVMYKTK